MDALIVSIQMVLVGKIIHFAKPYMYTLLLEKTYIYLLTLNKKQAIRVSRCRFCAKKNPAKPTSTHTYWEKAVRVSRCRFGGINMFEGFRGFGGFVNQIRNKIKKEQLSGRRLECLVVP